MKFKHQLLILLSLAFMSCKSQELTLMTYNIRLDVASDGENAWGNRKDKLTNEVLFVAPDVLGVQEAKPNQVEDLSERLKNYQKIGLGRDGGDKGEHSAIYYNSEKFKVGQSGTFWLSETPSEVSKGWDAAYPRICTYVQLTSLRSKKTFWVFNTHLDHVGEQARLEGIRLIMRRVKELNTANHPVMLMGDFNVEPESQLIEELASTMNDAKRMAQKEFGSVGTFNGFKVDQPVTRRIDYIMLSKSEDLEVESYAVLSNVIDQRYVSDHFPVIVKLRIN